VDVARWFERQRCAHLASLPSIRRAIFRPDHLLDREARRVVSKDTRESPRTVVRSYPYELANAINATAGS
jgi:hypothetical protein